MIKPFLSLALFGILLIGQLSAQSQSVRMFIFGHSLIDHRPPAIPTPSNETTVPHWLAILSEAGGHSYAAAGQYGFLPQHRQLPPFSQWGYDLVSPAWDSDNESFAEADINTVLLTAGNFMQWQGPDQDYPTDPGVSPVSATMDIIDWLAQQGDSAKVYIYENWPDMAPYLNSGFPPSAQEFAAYNAYTEGEFHDWWLSYQDELLAERPMASVRMIPVGPSLSKLFEDFPDFDIPLLELYEDDAPHGRPTLYFLASLITYMAIYEEPAPPNFEVPSTVHQQVAQRYAEIVDFFWQELQAFNLNDGTSRVFCLSEGPVSTDDVPTGLDWEMFPNPASSLLRLDILRAQQVTVEVLDLHGRCLLKARGVLGPAQLDISDLAAGVYQVRIMSEQKGTFSNRLLVVQ